MRITARCGAALLCLAALATPTYAGRPQTYPNSLKYRDDGAKPATGRSGSAAIQARALRGMHETDVEVTTGQFDSTAAPLGNLDKVQVKMLAPNGDVIVTDNYRKGDLSGATGTFTYDWPMRGQAVQVQANVSGIDPKRTDVVTVDTTVKLRPDLMVWAIYAPSTEFVGANVTIDAVIRERFGDNGARANCVLKVDGVVTDQANGIWVDAGDRVTVEFRQTFATLGTHRVSVELADVVPGDYNGANNSRTMTIEIVQPTFPVWYTLSAQDQHYEAVTITDQHDEFQPFDTSYYPANVSDQSETFTWRQHDESFYANLQTPKGVTFPVTLEGSLIVDGQTFLAPSFTVDANVHYGWDGVSVTCGEENESNQWFQVCNYLYGAPYAPSNMTTMQTTARAGSVTYNSHSVGQTRYPDLGLTYVYESNNGPYSFVQGDALIPIPDALPNNLVIHAALTDAANVHIVLEGSVDLYAQPDSINEYDNGCTSYDYSYPDTGHYFGWRCSHATYSTTSRAGFNSGTINIPE